MVLVCHECDEIISDLGNGLVVIVRDSNRNYHSGHLVHKGDCDKKLESKSEYKGLNTNSSMEISSLGNEDNINYYLSTGENPFDR
ncbi:hypothetical protein NY607_20650 [Lysinibacillus sp. A4]|uniref:hypothetical protein n=1 Tax=Bacillales TaxID=1385 RepID=UPI00217571C3|nr:MULTISPECIES: hypothetical protein [unclassified Lysinibacillus]MCS5503524.1 hypothetical protein [Lysinibacillus sp. A4]WGT39263.1 hypothetical protein QH639_00045 [Lysinibacillus sp. 1 U-2021]